MRMEWGIHYGIWIIGLFNAVNQLVTLEFCLFKKNHFATKFFLENSSPSNFLCTVVVRFA